MKRILVFVDDEAGRSHFQFVHEAMRFGRSQDREPPTLDVLRLERRIFRELDRISEPDPERIDLRCPGCHALVRKADAKARRLQAGGGTVTMADEDVRAIRSRLEDRKVMWTPESAAGVVDAADFLQDAPEAPDGA